ncbi:MAG: hypothetical protein M1325_01420 [Actinobacteria bacterium]|nr:hypothetical protein [Actinomycetota bacterium]
MTVDELRRLEAIEQTLSGLTVAVGKLTVSVETVERLRAEAREEEADYRSRQERDCQRRHAALERRLEDADRERRGAFGFQSRLAGALIALNVLLVSLGGIVGLVYTIGRMAGSW